MWIQTNENLRRHSFIFLWTNWPYVQTKTVIKKWRFRWPKQRFANFQWWQCEQRKRINKHRVSVDGNKRSYRTVWWGRWLPIARGHRRAREHYGAVAVLILNKPLISRPQICQSCLWESQKTWKVGSFITMKLLLSWWSGSLILVPVLLLNQPAFRRCPPGGYSPI